MRLREHCGRGSRKGFKGQQSSGLDIRLPFSNVRSYIYKVSSILLLKSELSKDDNLHDEVDQSTSQFYTKNKRKQKITSKGKSSFP